MAESGGTATLRTEVQAAIDAVPATAHAVVLRSGNILPTGSPTLSGVEFTSEFPRLTLTSMIAPTPDWFVGVSGLRMLDNQGRWLRSHEVNLYPWDAGTEDDVASNNGFSLLRHQHQPEGAHPQPARRRTVHDRAHRLAPIHPRFRQHHPRSRRERSRRDQHRTGGDVAGGPAGRQRDDHLQPHRRRRRLVRGELRHGPAAHQGRRELRLREQEQLRGDRGGHRHRPHPRRGDQHRRHGLAAQRGRDGRARGQARHRGRRRAADGVGLGPRRGRDRRDVDMGALRQRHQQLEHRRQRGHVHPCQRRPGQVPASDGRLRRRPGRGPQPHQGAGPGGGVDDS